MVALGDSPDIVAITVALKGLLKMKRNREGPLDIDWEIRLYEWMLRQPDVGQKCKQYFKLRFGGVNGLMSKRLIAKKLGWEII